MRAKKNRNKRLECVTDFFVKYNDEKIDVSATFGTEKKRLLLEIGCGKGKFATALSKKFADSNIIAVEKVPDVLLMAMEKAKIEECSGLAFANFDAANIDVVLDEKSVDSLYLNFSDPWPRKKNAKRRLTSPIFLEKYKHILKDEAKIYFKTDNRALFDYSLETFEQNGYSVENVTFDLHSSSQNEDNIETEYENNFAAKGFTINYLEAFLK
ncbi:MAG: tRNA (guanosine(46)-N7)-methyltransferase TrmB [Clostridia bacterium]